MRAKTPHHKPGAGNPIIPAKTLEATLVASNKMLQCAATQSKKAALDALVGHLGKILNAESCAVFLVSGEAPKELRLVASFCGKLKHRLAGKTRFEIASKKGGGLTGYLANFRRVVRLGSSALQANPYVAYARRKHQHLVSGNCFSLLSVPLLDMKGRLSGLLKVENKRGPNGKAGAEVAFDETDERIVCILSDAIISILAGMDADTERRSGEAFFAAIGERLPFGLYLKDISGTYIYSNERYARRLGLRPTDLYGKTDEVFFSKAQAARHKRIEEEVMRSRVGKESEEGEVSSNARRRLLIRIHRDPVMDSRGNVIGIQVVSWDISMEKEEVVVHAEEAYLFRMFLDRVPDNIYFKDRDSRFILINRHLAEQFGLVSVKEAVGKTDVDFFRPEHAMQALEDERRVMERGVPVEREELDLGTDGRECYVMTTKFPLLNGEGKTVGTFGISRDIDELVRTRNLFRDVLHTLERGNAHDAVRTLFSGLAKIYRYEVLVLYRFDRPHRVLRGMTGWGVEDCAIALREFHVPNASHHEGPHGSLVETVFYSRRAKWVRDVFQPPCNIEGARALKLKKGMSGIGMPLEVDGRFLGVMVAYCRGDNPAMKEEASEGILTPFADICGLALSVADGRRRTSDMATATRMRALIEAKIGGIWSNPEFVRALSLGAAVKNARSEFGSFMAIAARFLHADIGALYLADQPVCARSGNSAEVDAAYTAGRTRFVLRAMYNYPSNWLDTVSYTPGEKSLTGSVLRSCEPRLSRDVQSESDWSKKGAAELVSKYRSSGGLRTWLAVPVCFEQAGRTTLFGLISFTRQRDNEDDSLAFAQGDRTVCVSMAKHLGNIFQNLHAALLENALNARREAVEILSCGMIHETFKPVERANANIQILQDPNIWPGLASVPIQSELAKVRGLLGETIGTLNILLEAARAKVALAPEAARCKVDLVAMAKEIQEKLSNGYPEKTIEWSVSEGKYIAFVQRESVSIIMENLVKNAIIHNHVGHKVGLYFIDNGAVVDIRVEDDGERIPAAERSLLFRPFFRGSKAQAMTEGTGLGLHLSEALARMNGGLLRYDDDYSKGCCFVLTLPK